MVKLYAPILAALLAVQGAAAQGAFQFSNPNYFPNVCKKAGQLHMYYTEGPATYTAQLLTNIGPVANPNLLSFFPVTKYLKDVTSQVPLKQAVNLGATIGLRWPTDINLANASSADIVSTLNTECTTLYTYTQKYVKYIYLPENQITKAAYDTVVAQGYVPIGYTIDSMDYAYATSNSDSACISGVTQNYRNYLQQLPNGSAYWMAINRDLYACSAIAAPQIVATVRSFNYTLVSLGECLGDANPYRTSCSGAAAPPPAASATTAAAAATTAAAPPAAATTTAAAKSGASSLFSSLFTTLAALVVVAVAFARL